MGIIALLVAVLSIPLLYELDPDFGWHVFLGNHMQATGSLTHTLVGYSYFADRQLIDHQWLSHYFLNRIYSHFGYFPLILLCAGIVYVTCLFAYLLAKRQGIAWQYIVLSLLLYLSSLKIVYGVRLQLILMLGVASFMWIGRHVPHVWQRRILYFLLFCIGNNLHGGFIILTVIPALLELRGKISRAYFLTMGIVVLGLLLNPNGISLVHLTWDYLSDPYYKSHIVEWRSLFSLPISGETSVFPLMSILFLLSLKKFWRQIPWNEGLLLIFFGVLGVTHIRFFPTFVLIAVPYVALALQQEFLVPSRHTTIVIYSISGLWLLGNLLGISFPNLRWPVDMKEAPGYPGDAMKYISTSPKCSDALLNPYDWGGYILGFYPGQTVFIDGRGPQLKITPSTTLLQENDLLYQKDTAQINSKLETYGVRCVLIQKNTTQREEITTRLIRAILHLPQPVNKNMLAAYLNTSPVWKQVYEDSISAILEQ